MARPAGSAAEADAREVCAEWLSEAGFSVSERPFSYSALPGTLGTPVAGVVLLVAAIVASTGVWRGGDALDQAVAGAILAIAALALVGWWAGRFGTRCIPFMRRRGVNLEAQRGVPVVWLVAHLDSKSQPVSLRARAWAAIIVAGSWVAVLAAWIVLHLLPVPGAVLQPVLLTLIACAAIAAVPLSLCWVGSRGAGSLDNASGVAAILGAARLLDLATPVGVVVTSGEELGLAGARAWVEGVPRGVAINCDGVDDQGTVAVTTCAPERERWHLAGLDGACNLSVGIRRSLPGVLLDSQAFADRGWPACTISRGTRRSLARVHTATDTLDVLSGAGIEEVSRLIAFLAGAIIAGRRSSEYIRREVLEAHGTAKIER